MTTEGQISEVFSRRLAFAICYMCVRRFPTSFLSLPPFGVLCRAGRPVLISAFLGSLTALERVSAIGKPVCTVPQWYSNYRRRKFQVKCLAGFGGYRDR